jgi:hypothetical protein
MVTWDWRPCASSTPSWTIRQNTSWMVYLHHFWVIIATDHHLQGISNVNLNGKYDKEMRKKGENTTERRMEKDKA